MAQKPTSYYQQYQVSVKQICSFVFRDGFDLDFPCQKYITSEVVSVKGQTV